MVITFFSRPGEFRVEVEMMCQTGDSVADGYILDIPMQGFSSSGVSRRPILSADEEATIDADVAAWVLSSQQERDAASRAEQEDRIHRQRAWVPAPWTEYQIANTGWISTAHGLRIVEERFAYPTVRHGTVCHCTARVELQYTGFSLCGDEPEDGWAPIFETRDGTRVVARCEEGSPEWPSIVGLRTFVGREIFSGGEQTPSLKPFGRCGVHGHSVRAPIGGPVQL